MQRCRNSGRSRIVPNRSRRRENRPAKATHEQQQIPGCDRVRVIRTIPVGVARTPEILCGSENALARVFRLGVDSCRPSLCGRKERVTYPARRQYRALVDLSRRDRAHDCGRIAAAQSAGRDTRRAPSLSFAASAAFRRHAAICAIRFARRSMGPWANRNRTTSLVYFPSGGTHWQRPSTGLMWIKRAPTRVD